mmetsp:Transcript_35993/g.90303  ORF Transcript_35993/g.90303 Transcript_35993/m.90303 type:complete len:389 (+) Transcript_35993:2-1168(+)
MLVVIVAGAFNRVASKIMTEPMGAYSFFLSLWNSIVYTLVYFIILFSRIGLKITPRSHLSFPWRSLKVPENVGESRILRLWHRLPLIKLFIIMGFMDGLGNILGLMATPYISGPLTSLTSQAIVVFSMLSAVILLRTKYTLWQCLAALIVLAGAIICLIPDLTNLGGNDNTGEPATKQLLYSILMAVSTAPNAISFTLKEFVFDVKNDLDVFVVNSHSSMWGLILWPIFVPLTLLFDQTNGQNLWKYLGNAFMCFTSHTPDDGQPHHTSCSVDPWPWVIYMCVNLVFNISLLVLLKISSALQGFMAIKAILPISVLLFYINWPLIGSTDINFWILIGLAVVLTGLILFRLTTLWRDQMKGRAGCFSVIMPFGPFKPPPSLLEEDEFGE